MSASHLHVGNRRIGSGERVFVIAEIGINHQGNLDTARRLIDAAAAAGADAVKFQKRSLPDLYDAALLANPNLGEQKFQYLLPLLKEVEFTIEQHRELQRHSADRGVLYFSTPFDIPSADALATLNPPVYKIGSPDLTNVPLLEHVAALGEPVLVSTGMAEEAEIDASVRILKRCGVPFGLFHVNSTYPAPFDEVNLRFMERLAAYGVPVGYSGHERGIAVALAAVARGASMIERHLTFDRGQEGPDHKASLLPDEFTAMVKGIREIEVALGTGRRRLTQVEVMNREALGKSVVAACPIHAGERITKPMLTTRSPSKGLSPQRLGELVGTTAKRDLAAGEHFADADLSPTDATPVFDPRRVGFRWAPVVRFSDVGQFLAWAPPALEFHFTDKDLEERLLGGPYQQELIVHAPEYAHRSLVDLASPDDAVRRRSVESLWRTVEKVHEIAKQFPPQTPKLVLHPGGYTLTPFPRPAEMLAALADSLAQVDFSGLELLLENLPPRPWFFGGEWVANIFLAAGEIQAFLDAHQLRMCLDTSHAQLAGNVAGTSLLNFCLRLRPYVRHLHLSDAEGLGEEGLQIGDGEVHWEGIAEIFRGFDGTITPEVWQGHLEGGKGFLLALERLAPYFAKVREHLPR